MEIEAGTAGMETVDRHFAAENAHDVAATLATYTDDIVWDDITHPLSPVRGKDAVGAVYGDILGSIPDLVLRSVRRFSSDDGRWVVDESIASGHVHGAWAGVAGGGAFVEVRMLHVFEIRDGLDRPREHLVRLGGGRPPGRGVDGGAHRRLRGVGRARR